MEFDVDDFENQFNLLYSGLQFQKKRVILKKVKEKLLATPKKELTNKFESLHVSLFSGLNDKDETLREITMDILEYCISEVDTNNKYLDAVMPIILFRLGSDEEIEHSEELRSKLVHILMLLIQTYHKSIDVYVEEIVTILSRTLLDSFPDARRKSCLCCKYMSYIKEEVWFNYSYKLVKPILANFKHQHWRTRAYAVEALMEVMKNGDWKHVNAQEIFGSIGERLFDSSPSIRLSVIKILEDWCLNARDRYSHFSRMVPLFLSCLADEGDQVRESAWEAWERVGIKYLSENEQELKDKIDFLEGKIEHYPKGVRRANLGCRTLVQRNTYQITTPLLKELTDWKTGVRIKSSELLVTLILHAESEITQHLETILLSLYSIAEFGDPQIVIDNMEKAAEYMAYFVPPRTWHQLILPIMEEGVKLGHLRVLAALCRGCQPEHLEPYAEQIINILADPSVCNTRNDLYQVNLLKCCRALLDNVGTIATPAIKPLYKCLLRVGAVTTEDAIRLISEDCMQLLAKKADSSYEDLGKENIPSLIEDFTKTVEGWTAIQPDFLTFIRVLNQPAIVWSSMKEEIMSLLRLATKEEIVPTARNQLFLQLTKSLDAPDVKQIIGEDGLFEIIQDLIVPNLTWRAGRTAEALRTTVVACLNHILQAHCVNLQKSSKLLLLFPHLIACLRDDALTTRQLSLQCLTTIIETSSELDLLTTDHVNAMYREVLGRLDDVSDPVRFAAIDCLKTLFSSLPKEFTEQEYKPHFENIIQILLTHFDDPDEKVQLQLFDILKSIGKNAPGVLKSAVDKRRHLYVSQIMLDSLLEDLPKLSIG